MFDEKTDPDPKLYKYSTELSLRKAKVYIFIYIYVQITDAYYETVKKNAAISVDPFELDPDSLTFLASGSCWEDDRIRSLDI